jgi:aryl-alcohol dehydrogenase-like predicted oxidoreductase
LFSPLASSWHQKGRVNTRPFVSSALLPANLNVLEEPTRNWRTLDVVGEISEETGRSYVQIALNWLLCQEGVTAPIIGARRLEQLEDNLGAAGWELSPEQVARLDRASAIEDIYPYRMIREMQRV